MPISPLLLEIDSYYVRSLHLEANDEYSDEHPSLGAVVVDFAIYPDSEDRVNFQIAMTIDIESSDRSLNEPYALHLDLYGFFRFKPEASDEVITKMLFSNAVPMLYGIARGNVGQVTGISFHGPLMLPPYNFVELTQRKAAQARERLAQDSAPQSTLPTAAEEEPATPQTTT